MFTIIPSISPSGVTMVTGQLTGTLGSSLFWTKVGEFISASDQSENISLEQCEGLLAVFSDLYIPPPKLS
jgi:hypothetical protein